MWVMRKFSINPGIQAILLNGTQRLKGKQALSSPSY